MADGGLSKFCAYLLNLVRAENGFTSNAISVQISQPLAVIITTYTEQKNQQMTVPKDRVIIASDVNERDGIGIEIYRDDKLVVEIFRDDTKLTRTVTLFQQNITLELLEESITTFKKEIPWDFIK